ncbi:MAG: hypothetical protein ACTHMW_16125 [Actinomycetes bacterium]
MPHPNRRTWTLGGLDRDASYRLWFDHEAFRWEVERLAEDERPATDGPAEEPAPARRRWWP